VIVFHFDAKNINCSIKESMDRFRSVVAVAREHNIPVRGYLSCVIACPYQGATSPKVVGRTTEMLLDLGCYEVSLGDTIGVGTPASTVDMLDAALLAAGGKQDLLAVHFHDT
jgi:hydroxymethylglutaryl-CoA lyase